MYFNYSIEQCKQSIFEVIEKSQLPIGVIYYLFKDISNELNQIYNATLQQEIAQMRQSNLAENEVNAEVENE